MRRTSVHSRRIAGRFLLVGAVVAGTALGAVAGTSPAGASTPKTPKPVITLSATPATVTTSEGQVSVTATVSNATNCILSTVPSLPETFSSVDCSGGKFTGTATLPENMATKKPVTYHLILTATGPGGTKAKKIKVTVNPGAGTPPPLTGATSVVSDTYSSCALLASGGVDCWGDGIYGDLGNGAFAESPLPVHVVGVGGTGTLSGVMSLTSSGTFSYCALLTSGGVDCWGYGPNGELGNGTDSETATPVHVVGVGGTGILAAVESLSASYGNGTYCAVLVSGGVDCWGKGGTLGNGSYSSSDVPVQVVGVGGTGTLSGVASLAASQLSVCAVLTLGGVDCWGSGYNGDLGDGSSSDSAFPVQVVGVGGTDTLSGVTSLSASLNSYCALVPSVGVDCWGDDAFGELGDGSVSATGSATPVAVSGVGDTGTLTGVISVATDGDSYCVVLSSGGVDCWGGGPLGNGSTGQSSSPVAVSGVGGTGTLSEVASLGASAPGTVCALLTSGGVDCWGDSADGELGNGVFNASGSSAPVQVAGVGGSGTLSSVTSLFLAYHSNGSNYGGSVYAVLGTGELVSWGYGVSGVLGTDLLSTLGYGLPWNGYSPMPVASPAGA